MKTIQQHREELKKAAEFLQGLNEYSCAHYAKVLQQHDTYVRLCTEAGVQIEPLIDVDRFEMIYKLLSFAPLKDRATLMLGEAPEITRLLARTRNAGGFYTDQQHWIEL